MLGGRRTYLGRIDYSLTIVFSRLRFSFVNVKLPPGMEPPPMVVPNKLSGFVNPTKAPVMAQTFSEPFCVYSAKKFPGVCESTPLSKAFAQQGIKIPVRKDTTGKEEYEDY